MYRFSLALGAGVAIALGVATAVRADESSRLAESARIIQEIRSDIPAEYWDKARCVAVIPDLKKAAFILGGEYGKGVMSCRAGEAWSAPLFLQLAKGSWGFQAGAEQVDLVLLVMNESGAQKMLKNKVSLGVDASVAAGPIGRRGGVGTDAALTAEILSYSRSKGLFAGIDLSGGVLRPDEDANKDIYGGNATPSTILASREISAPTTAAPFIRALGRSAAPAATPRAETTTSRATTTAAPVGKTGPENPTTTAAAGRTATAGGDDSVRAQLVDAQQMLDRILADTTPPAVGTSGTAGTTSETTRSSGTITVERARLMQLRSQIEAAIAALNRR
jgi:lipid-binding SYLF domain-containing protein